MKIPKIKGKKESHDFHDSSLIDIILDPHLDKVAFILSTPDEAMREHLWCVRCSGVVRLEYETLGDGSPNPHKIPIEISNVYRCDDCDELERWRLRFKDSLDEPSAAKELMHLVLASGFVRGWGDRESLDGISVICRNFTVEVAPSTYRGREYHRPRIEADGE
ncbi:MAG: hypothetical protein ABIN58_04960 [candidate division WOR-3 bacterium]